MDWRALEEHFRAAATQDPGPFGDDAIEWDHSRYARALGLAGEPGAHELPHRGCAVAALPPTRWDAAEARLRAWAEQRGWALWRISARPTVAVPDPVTYALGARAAGSLTLALARASRRVPPAMGRRSRSEGMSFPLTPGERWLIGTDRVRRRMRAEIARRGLVVFVEEAEWLTPAGLAVLVYLLDAHRAWKARMLSRAACVYVVLATAPEHETSVLRMLKRFRLAGHTPVLRERRRSEGADGASPPVLRDAEEEYLFSALAAAPAALATEDVRAAFGASAVDRCRAMVERGLLRERAEAGQVCYAPDPAIGVAASAPPRALAAIASLYRQRARRGHEHLHLAAAAVSLMLDQPYRAAAAVARMPHTAGALLPLRIFEMLDPALGRLRQGLKADHMAAWFSIVAHSRAYDRAREVANAVTESELRTWKELYRVVRVTLCTGRTHLDSCMPHDFWPRLKAQRIAGPFMDAICVLAELFWRKRYLDNSEIRQRYEFACDCFERADPGGPASRWADRLDRIGRLVIYRAALHLETPTSILCSTAAPEATLRSFLRAEQVPALVAAAPVFAESASGPICMRRSFDGADRHFAESLGATTGHPADLAVTTATAGGHLSRRGLRLLLRDHFDDLLLPMSYRANVSDRHDIGRFLLYVSGGRGRLVGVNAVFLKHGRQDVPGRDASDELAAAESLLQAGDVVGAHDRLMVGLARPIGCPLLLASVLSFHATLARKSLDVEALAATGNLVEQRRALLGPELCRYLTEMLRGSEALCTADFAAAQRAFLKAYRILPGAAERAQQLKRDAIVSSVRAGYAQRVATNWSVRGSSAPTVWEAVRRICAGAGWETATSDMRTRAAVSLDYLCGMVNAFAGRERNDNEILRLATFLRDSVDAAFRPMGREFVEVMGQWAPRFHDRLRSAVIATVGDPGVAAPEARALGAAIRTISDAWKDDLEVVDGGRWDRVRIRNDQSQARQAKRADAAWQDDATTYAQLWDARGRVRTCPGGERIVVAYGHVGRSPSKPIATALRLKVSPVNEQGFEVEVDAQPGALATAFAEKRRLSRPLEARAAFVGRSAAAEKVVALIDAAARCSYPVLITGETGTGKDLVARCIHMASGRRVKPLVTADCASTVESLLESELFGHERGAFTGAHAAHQGVFERANGSSLLLDEADSMPRRMQAAVLRVLESGEYRRVGGSVSRKSEFRLITTALPRLFGMVETGEFRQDLFYRISALRIEIPPLRDRGGDAEEIATAHAQSLGLRLTSGSRRAIVSYHWPGNVRQLQHCIQAAGLHATDGRIGEAAMSEVIGSYVGARRGERPDRESTETVWTRALHALEREKRFGAWEFAKAAGLSRRSAQRHIARLVRLGRIVRIGAGRATEYRVCP